MQLFTSNAEEDMTNWMYLQILLGGQCGSKGWKKGICQSQGGPSNGFPTSEGS